MKLCCVFSTLVKRFWAKFFVSSHSFHSTPSVEVRFFPGKIRNQPASHNLLHIIPWKAGLFLFFFLLAPALTASGCCCSRKGKFINRTNFRTQQASTRGEGDSANIQHTHTHIRSRTRTFAQHTNSGDKR